jgi:uncharacterized membrane protein YuzA (DUF378 family)
MNNNRIFCQNITERRFMKTFQKIVLAFTIIGALNWGLIGLFNFNLVEALFGVNTTLTKIVYSVVGICGLINIGIYFYKFEV